MEYHIHSGTDSPKIDFKNTTKNPKAVLVRSSEKSRYESLGEKTRTGQTYGNMKAIKMLRAGRMKITFSFKADANFCKVKLLVGTTEIGEYVIGFSPYDLTNTYYDIEEEFDVRELDTVAIQGATFNATGEIVYIKDARYKFDTYIKQNEDNLVILN